MKKSFLLLLLAKSGVQLTPDLKAAFDAAKDTDIIDLTPEVETSIGNALLGIEDAKKHPKLMDHFKGELFSATDTAVKESLENAGFPEAEIKTIMEGKTATERIKAAAAAIKEKTGKPVGDTKEEIKKITDTLNAEKAERAKEKSVYENNLKEKENELTSYKKSVALDNFLNIEGGFNLRSDWDRKKVTKLAKEDLEEFAKANDFAIVPDGNGGIKLENAKTPGADIYINNQKVTDFKDIATRVLTEGKYLATAEHTGGNVSHQTAQSATPAGYRSAAAANHSQVSQAVEKPQ